LEYLTTHVGIATVRQQRVKVRVVEGVRQEGRGAAGHGLGNHRRRRRWRRRRVSMAMATTTSSSSSSGTQQLLLLLLLVLR